MRFAPALQMPDWPVVWPGILTAITIALAATFISEHQGGPQLLYALFFGMAFNFAANGDPNGTDRDGTPLPVWDPCIGEECPAMHLCQEPGMRTDWLTETDRKAFGL